MECANLREQSTVLEFVRMGGICNPLQPGVFNTSFALSHREPSAASSGDVGGGSAC